MEPAISPDGSFMVFISNRPDAGGGAPVEGFYSGKAQKGGRLWRVDRALGGWSAPYALPDRVNASTSIYAPAIAGDGSVYFMTTDKISGRFRLYRSQYRNGNYESPTELPFSDGTFTDVDPAVSPDESFLIFGSSRKAGRGIDLFVVFREGGVWGRPVHLRDDVNSPLSDAEPRLSNDGLDLYFSSERTITVHFPRSKSQAIEDVARMEDWDNGNYNIWKVPLAKVIARARRAE
jgi:Tol biopolymer transport system component